MPETQSRFYEVIGEAIRQRRRSVCWSQQDLAKQVGVSRVTLSHIEHGRQRVDVYTVQLIARALGVTFDDLVPHLVLADDYGIPEDLPDAVQLRHLIEDFRDDAPCDEEC